MSRAVKIGNLTIGGGAPVLVQSMTNTPTTDNERTLFQVRELENAGCDIVRIAVSTPDEVAACRKIIGKVRVPLVADVQFDYRIAIACADIGFDKIRFNPGLVGDKDKIAELVLACRRNGIPMRVGVNGGSLDREIRQKYSGAEALAQSALKHVRLLEECDFYDTVISVKSSDVTTSVRAYEILHEKCDYPLHLGVTESGMGESAIVKSAIGIGSLLLNGIGDTLRVSMTGDPVREVEIAKHILRALKIERDYVEIVSCPTCSRCGYDLEKTVNEVTKAVSGIKRRLKIAVMGCVVNGPGEAEDADIAVCGGGDGKAALYLKGKFYATINAEDAAKEVLAFIDKIS